MLKVSFGRTGVVEVDYDGSAPISDIEIEADSPTVVFHFAEDQADQPVQLRTAKERAVVPEDALPWVVLDRDVDTDNPEDMRPSVIGRFATRPEAEACVVGLDFLDRSGTKLGRYSITGPEGPAYP